MSTTDVTRRIDALLANNIFQGCHIYADCIHRQQTVNQVLQVGVEIKVQPNIHALRSRLWIHSFLLLISSTVSWRLISSHCQHELGAKAVLFTSWPILTAIGHVVKRSLQPNKTEQFYFLKMKQKGSLENEQNMNIPPFTLKCPYPFFHRHKQKLRDPILQVLP